jgi:imidazoleglycerol-phosphate dehydratase/histidinol-phosphatase
MNKEKSKIVRKADYRRKTKETDIKIKLDLDGNGKNKIKTGVGFFDHMLEQLAKHSNINMEISVKGDLHIDEHHTVEDVGIALGEGISNALGNRKSIERFGFMLPMDDALAQCAIDLGGRPYLSFTCKFKREKIGDFPTELFKEFFRGLSLGMRANIHIKAEGENDHHKAEAIFKAFARALNSALKYDTRNKGSLPSTKGVI